MGKPVIGVMPQYSEKDTRLMIGENFFYAIAKAGGIPVLLPLFSPVEDVKESLDRFDGFLYPGGPDINPLIFGEDAHPQCGNILPARDTLELALFPAISCLGKPVFGICRGIQVMNVALGGTLYQDIATQNAVTQRNIGHYQKAGDAVLTHSVDVEKGKLLYEIVGKERLFVNSFHHQSCKELGAGMAVNATAADGVVEAVALKNHKFFLGVQWHPEHLYEVSEDMAKIWNAFVGSCKSR